ncbi:MAG: hypothetical protein NVS3B12_29180 [Acidimicrobiales bacterium]
MAPTLQNVQKIVGRHPYSRNREAIMATPLTLTVVTMTRSEHDRCAQGHDGFVFEDLFEEAHLEPMSDAERRELFETVRS